MEPNKTVEEFFKDLPKEEQEAVKEPIVEVKVDEEGDVRKNRRHRRLEQQLAEEREARIAAEARANALSETQQFKKEVGGDDVDPRWLQIYGDTPESKKAWKLQQEIFDDRQAKLEEATMRKIEERQLKEAQEQKAYESLIDSNLEAIEDKYNIDITSDSPAARKVRREFLEVVEQLSPKDDDGTITDYADFDAAYNMYQASLPSRDNSRRREIASNSMEDSGIPDIGKANDDATLNYLREQGIRI